VSSPAGRAEAIAARLSAAGWAPNVKQRKDRVCVEIEAPASLSPESWRALLAVLEAADRYGFDRGNGGVTAWAAVLKETPAAT
jgi:hypothetical protein